MQIELLNKKVLKSNDQNMLPAALVILMYGKV